jgi:hypothetical protein
MSIMKKAAKHKQSYHYHQAMVFFKPCLYLAEASPPRKFAVGGIEMKSFDALEQMANKTNNKQLLFDCFLSRITELFWMREYKDVVKLSEQFQQPQSFRIMDVFRRFYEGIASFGLARETSGEESQKWRKKGLACVSQMVRLEKLSA